MRCGRNLIDGEQSSSNPARKMLQGRGRLARHGYRNMNERLEDCLQFSRTRALFLIGSKSAPLGRVQVPQRFGLTTGFEIGRKRLVRKAQMRSDIPSPTSSNIRYATRRIAMRRRICRAQTPRFSPAAIDIVRGRRDLLRGRLAGLIHGKGGERPFVLKLRRE